MKRRFSNNAILISLSMIVSATLIAGGVAYANGANITACVKKSNGATRILSGKMKCTKSERQITWGQTGPQGSTGATGATGATGPQGPAGPAGADATAIFGKLYSNGTLDTTKTTAAVTSSFRNSAGTYTVNFNRDVSNCVAVATHETEVQGWPDLDVDVTADRVSTQTIVFYAYRPTFSTTVDVEISFAVFCR